MSFAKAVDNYMFYTRKNVIILIIINFEVSLIIHVFFLVELLTFLLLNFSSDQDLVKLSNA